MTFESTFVNAGGRTSRGQFIPALITLLAATALYVVYVKGRTGQWSLLVLLFPAIVLHARRLHDMGRSAWLLLVPSALIAASIWLRMVSNGTQVEATVTYLALGVSALFALWGLVGKSQAQANRFGEPAGA
ncbi:MAG: DUF805 domain-containing protein [Caulobacteraceae bacterium]